jgi:hypothetical protein
MAVVGWLAKYWWVWALLSVAEIIVYWVLSNESAMPVYGNF